jgi:alanine racemase
MSVKNKIGEFIGYGTSFLAERKHESGLNSHWLFSAIAVPSGTGSHQGQQCIVVGSVNMNDDC